MAAAAAVKTSKLPVPVFTTNNFSDVVNFVRGGDIVVLHINRTIQIENIYHNCTKVDPNAKPNLKLAGSSACPASVPVSNDTDGKAGEDEVPTSLSLMSIEPTSSSTSSTSLSAMSIEPSSYSSSSSKASTSSAKASDSSSSSQSTSSSSSSTKAPETTSLENIRVIYIDMKEVPDLMGKGEWPDFLAENNVCACSCDLGSRVVCAKDVPNKFLFDIPSPYETQPVKDSMS